MPYSNRRNTRFKTAEKSSLSSLVRDKFLKISISNLKNITLREKIMRIVVEAKVWSAVLCNANVKSLFEISNKKLKSISFFSVEFSLFMKEKPFSIVKMISVTNLKHTIFFLFLKINEAAFSLLPRVNWAVWANSFICVSWWILAKGFPSHT